jgi:hypothetical protein
MIPETAVLAAERVSACWILMSCMLVLVFCALLDFVGCLATAGGSSRPLNPDAAVLVSASTVWVFRCPGHD